MTPLRLFPLLALLLSASRALALGVGDPAPALKTGTWVQGGPVAAFEKDKVYVVEFWATWCGPCRTSIPRLNELQARHREKGLVVIGQNVWEETESKVAGFVRKMGDKMTYAVALDDKSKHEEGAMAETWMKAANQDGIPTAFVVGKDGRIAWIGHPAEGLDEVVAGVLAGTFDAKKAEEIRAKQAAEAEKVALSYEKISAAMENGEWEDALKAVDELEKLLVAPEDRQAMITVRVQILAGAGDADKLYAYIKATAEKHADNLEILNDLAWSLVATPGIENPDLDLAEKLARQSNELAKEKQAHVLDTLARIAFLQGQRKAVALQEKAVAAAEEEEKELLEETLETYRNGFLPSAEELNEMGIPELEPEMQDEPEAQDV